MRIGIHQPNFFPWLGFYSKIMACDSFVFLDDAQIQKTGGSWSNRALLEVGSNLLWATAPLDKESKKKGSLREVEFQESDWQSKLTRTIENRFSKSPFFEQEWPFWKELINFQTKSLLDFNMNAIDKFLGRYSPKEIPVIFSSEFNISTQGTDRLIEICQNLGASAYVHGEGALDYQVDADFQKNKISLLPLRYKQPELFLAQGFNEGLSTLDSIFRAGPIAIKNHLQYYANENRQMG